MLNVGVEQCSFKRINFIMLNVKRGNSQPIFIVIIIKTVLETLKFRIDASVVR